MRVWGRAGSNGGRNKPKKGDRRWKNDSVCQSPQLGSAPLLFTVDNLHWEGGDGGGGENQWLCLRVCSALIVSCGFFKQANKYFRSYEAVLLYRMSFSRVSVKANCLTHPSAGGQCATTCFSPEPTALASAQKKKAGFDEQSASISLRSPVVINYSMFPLSKKNKTMKQFYINHRLKWIWSVSLKA